MQLKAEPAARPHGAAGGSAFVLDKQEEIP